MCLSEDHTLQLRQQHISILTRSLIETQNARVRLELMSILALVPMLSSISAASLPRHMRIDNLSFVGGVTTCGCNKRNYVDFCFIW